MLILWISLGVCTLVVSIQLQQLFTDAAVRSSVCRSLQLLIPINEQWLVFGMVFYIHNWNLSCCILCTRVLYWDPVIFKHSGVLCQLDCFSNLVTIIFVHRVMYDLSVNSTCQYSSGFSIVHMNKMYSRQCF